MSTLGVAPFVTRAALVGVLLSRAAAADAHVSGFGGASGNVSAARATYSEEVAKRFLGLSQAAYCNAHDWFKDEPGVSLENWTCGPACQRVSGVGEVELVDKSKLGFAHVVKRTDGDCVVAFQGTASVSQAVADLASLRLVKLEKCTFEGKDCLVGGGFLASYNDMKKDIVASIRTLKCGGIAVTGHSLGAAQAVLAMFDLHSQGYAIKASYTFGQPVVGDATFNAAFRKALGSTPLFRVTHGADIVVHLGPCTDEGLSQVHEGVEVFYAKGISDGYKICNENKASAGCSTAFFAKSTGVDFAADFRDGSCWRKVARKVLMLLITHPEAKSDHLHYFEQPTGAEENCCPRAKSCESGTALLYP